MNIQTFRADNMHEALQQVRRELGPDAAVLRTREVRGGLMRWLLGKSQVEICATGEMATAGRAAATRPVQSAKSVTERPRPAVRERLPLGEVGLDLAALAGATAGLSSSAELPATSNLTRTGGQATRGTQFETIGGPFAPPSFVPPQPIEPPALACQSHLANSLKSLLSPSIPGERIDWLCELLRYHLPNDINAAETISRRQLRAAVARALPVRQPPQLRPGNGARLAFVGPTGVGKTTNIAKLAAHYSLRQCLRVGLMTTDTFRIAAVEQLRAYAEILSIPLEVVSQPNEVPAALARLSDLDVVLIDTAGLCLLESDKHAEVQQVLAAANCSEVFAVLNASGEVGWLERASRRLKQLGANSLILTKLDDVSQHGGLLPLLLSGELPLSFVSCGQQVPDDLEPANAVKLAECLIA